MLRKKSIYSNNRGQMALFGIMMFIFVFAFALICIPTLKDLISEARSPAGLDCANNSISTGTAATCLVVDLYLPYFIAAILMAGAAWMFARQVGGGA